MIDFDLITPVRSDEHTVRMTMEWLDNLTRRVVTNKMIKEFLKRIQNLNYGGDSKAFPISPGRDNENTYTQIIESRLANGELKLDEVASFLCRSENLYLKHFRLYHFNKAKIDWTSIEGSLSASKHRNVLNVEELQTKPPAHERLVSIVRLGTRLRFKYVFKTEESHFDRNNRIQRDGRTWIPETLTQARKVVLIEVFPDIGRIILRFDPIQDSQYNELVLPIFQQVLKTCHITKPEASVFLKRLDELRDTDTIKSGYMESRIGQTEVILRETTMGDLFSQSEAYHLCDTPRDGFKHPPIRSGKIEWAQSSSLPSTNGATISTFIEAESGYIKFRQLPDEPNEVINYVLRHLDDAFK